MMKDSYKFLGLTEDATNEEIDAAYKRLKEKYKQERFFEGEMGNEAAKNLTKLENAYTEIILERNSSKKEEKIGYSEIEVIIKEGNISLAQEKLDQITERDAEWHYLQAAIFHKKNWVNESKKQLEIAISMDPTNVKYSNTLAKLNNKTDFNKSQFNTRGYNSNPQEEPNRQMGDSGINDCMSFCATWCCMDMLFNICCGCR